MADYCTHTFRKIVDSYNWKNGSTIRSYRLRCKCCGYTWNVYYDKKLKKEVIPTAMSDNRILNFKRFTPEEVKLILTDPRAGTQLAKIFNVAPQSINQVRTGRAYKDLWPELPRVLPEVRNYKRGPSVRSTKVTCQDCEHWWQKQCGLGIPEAGGTFAVECSFFEKDE
jgi:hypothetical protein